MSTVNGSTGSLGGQMFFDNQIEGKYLSSAELAAYLGLSEHTIRAWRKYRMITPVKFGRSVRWLLKNVLEELTKRR
ncbi:MAG: helix-turn-helix domain-containing protein [Oligoflexales bacterium]